MKLQLVIVIVLRFLVLSNQENELLATEGEEDDDLFDISYSTNASEGDPATPCLLNLPGFSSVGVMSTFIVVFVLSMVGNSLVVCVFCSIERGRSSTDIYLMHLAMADLLFSLTLPFWAVELHSGWVFGNVLCKLLSGFQEASVYGGVFLLACISVDRHFAIVRATRVLSSRCTLVKVVCGAVWLTAGFLSLPVAVQRESMHDEDLGQSICYENLTDESGDRWRVGLRVVRHTVGFFLPLTVMVVCYGWTVATLLHTRNQQKQKAIRVILAVVLAFVVCWLPYNVTVLIDTLMRGGSLEETCAFRYEVEVMLNVTQVLAFTHCAVNPVLYAFIGQRFRNQLLLTLYKHSLISKKCLLAYRKGSSSSVGSTRSRVTSLNNP